MLADDNGELLVHIKVKSSQQDSDVDESNVDESEDNAEVEETPSKKKRLYHIKNIKKLKTN